MHPLKKELSKLSKDELVRICSVIMVPFIANADEEDIIQMNELSDKFDKRSLLLIKSDIYKMAMQNDGEGGFKKAMYKYIKDLVEGE